MTVLRIEYAQHAHWVAKGNRDGLRRLRGSVKPDSGWQKCQFPSSEGLPCAHSVSPEFELVGTVRKVWRGVVNPASRKHAPGRRVLLPYIQKTRRFDTFAVKDSRNVHQPRHVRPLYFRFEMSEENRLPMDAPGPMQLSWQACASIIFWHDVAADRTRT